MPNNTVPHRSFPVITRYTPSDLADNYIQHPPLWTCPHGVSFWTARRSTGNYRRVTSSCPDCLLFAGKSTIGDMRWVQNYYFDISANDNDDDEYFFPMTITAPAVDWEGLTPGTKPLAGVGERFWEDYTWSRHFDEQSGYDLAHYLLISPTGELGTILNHFAEKSFKSNPAYLKS